MKIGVVCSNVDKLVLELMKRRDLDSNNCDIHIGIDGGQGSLKVGMTVTDREIEETLGRSKYSEVSLLNLRSHHNFFLF